MTAGLMILASYGIENMYLTYNPQITFFKMVYKRHTNFSIESIPQFFNIQANFSNKVSCIISKNGDLINKIYVVVTLPNIQSLPNDIVIRWVDYIGYVLIKNVELEIDGKIIDKHCSDWFYIINELNKNNNNNGLNKMIGNIKLLTDYTKYKNDYTLYIPLEFWFCKYIVQSLPIIALENSEIKINIEFNDIENCVITGPTHYICISDTICLFKLFEFIQINDSNHYIIFINFNLQNMKMGYIKTNNNLSLKINDKLYGISSFFETKVYNPNNNIYLDIISNLEITNLTKSNTDFRNIYNIVLKNAFLFIDYIYLDNIERKKFIKSEHEYLISICQFDNDKNLYNTNNKIKLGYFFPTKEFIIRSQLDYMINQYYKNHFNYTTSIDNNKSKSLIKKIQIKLNGFNRETNLDKELYTYIQSLNYHNFITPKGVFLYSFSFYPSDYQPSGSANLTKIDDISIDLTLEPISYDNKAKIRVYAISYNVLKIKNGLAKLLF